MDSRFNPGGSSKQRKRWRKELERVLMQSRDVPWYEGTMLWGAGGSAIAIVLTVIAAMKHDLRWLLIFAWPFATLAVLAICRAVLNRKALVVTLTCFLSVACALALHKLDLWLVLPDDARPKLTVQSPIASSPLLTSTAKAWTPLRNRANEPELIFKPSPLFTSQKRDFIRQEIALFHLHLLALHVHTSSEPITVGVKGSKKSYEYQADQDSGEFYNNAIYIPTDSLSNEDVITDRYARYVIFRVVMKDRWDFPKYVPFDPNDRSTWGDSKENRDIRFRNALGNSIGVYLSETYWNRRQPDPFFSCHAGPHNLWFPVSHWWDIEKAYGKEFATQLAVFTAIAANKEPTKDSEKELSEFATERIGRALPGVDNEGNKFNVIKEILKQCDSKS
jgi:hypothetical protein